MNATIAAVLTFSLAGCLSSESDRPSFVDSLGIIACGPDSEKVARIKGEEGQLAKYSLVAVEASTGKIREDVLGTSAVNSICVSRFSGYRRVNKLSDAVLIGYDSAPDEAFVVYFHKNGELTVQVGDDIEAKAHVENGTVFADADRRYFFAVIDTVVHGELVETDVIAGGLKNKDKISSVFGIAHSKIELTTPVDREAIK